MITEALLYFPATAAALAAVRQCPGLDGNLPELHLHESTYHIDVRSILTGGHDEATDGHGVLRLSDLEQPDDLFGGLDYTRIAWMKDCAARTQSRLVLHIANHSGSSLAPGYTVADWEFNYQEESGDGSVERLLLAAGPNGDNPPHEVSASRNASGDITRS